MNEDLILSVRNGEIIFEALTPKGEEWCQLYTTDRPCEYTCELDLFRFKHKAQSDGLVVFVNR